jgi:hypothetical protein
MELQLQEPKKTAEGSLPTFNSIGSITLDDGQARWEDLQKTEKKRRSILLYGDDPVWKILTRYHGTVVPILCKDALLYITMAIYIGVRLMVYYTSSLPSFVAELVQGQITVVGGFIR